MNILYNKKEIKKQSFIFDVDTSADFKIAEPIGITVAIIFRDEKFSEVRCSVDEKYRETRSYWKLMQAINEKITEIEDNIKNKSA